MFKFPQIAPVAILATTGATKKIWDGHAETARDGKNAPRLCQLGNRACWYNIHADWAWKIATETHLTATGVSSIDRKHGFGVRHGLRAKNLAWFPWVFHEFIGRGDDLH